MTDERLAKIRVIREALSKCGSKMWGPSLSPFGDPSDVAADVIDDLVDEVDRMRKQVAELEREIESHENSAWERSERIGCD